MKKLKPYWQALLLRMRIYHIRALTHTSPECMSFCDTLNAAEMMAEDNGDDTLVNVTFRLGDLREFMDYMGGLHNSHAHNHNELVAAYFAALKDGHEGVKQTMGQKWKDEEEGGLT